MENSEMAQSNGYTVGSLFAGIGGVCQGFKDAGFEVLWANEYDANANKTYKANFSHRLDSSDIRKLDPRNFKKTDVITSGFPCQAFSIAGYRKGFNDDRGNLFFETMRFINTLKPKAFLLENVKNLISHDDGKTFQTIRDTILESGYSFIPKVMNSMDYGNVPQTRERIYIVGFRGEAGMELGRKENTCSANFEWPKRTPLTRTIRDILDTEKTEDRYYYKNNCLFYNELRKGMKSQDTVYQWRRIYLRENKSNVCPTLTANMGTGGHNVPLIVDNFGFRKLTPRECARLQGFKDSFIIPKDVCNAHLYKQFGNAVTVPVIKKIALNIASALNAVKNKKEDQKSHEEKELAVV